MKEHIDFISVGIKKPLYEKYARAMWCTSIPDDEVDDCGWNVTREEWDNRLNIISEIEAIFEGIANEIYLNYEHITHVTLWADETMIGVHHKPRGFDYYAD